MEETIKAYRHKVQYYETDKMGIVHHSNYIRWMEEARVDYLEQIGYGYDKLEKSGVTSPVVSVSCRYRHPCYFNDIVEVRIALKEYTGVKFAFEYQIVSIDGGALCAAGVSEHCMTNSKGRPVSIKREYPQIHNEFMYRLNEKQAEET